MRARRRRRLDMALLGAGALAVGGAGAFGAFVGQAEEIQRYWAAAEVEADGDAAVTEVIDYDFGAQSRHGIFRIVPDLDPTAGVSVSSPDAPDDVLITVEGQDTNIRIGHPDRTVTGEHRYELRYSLTGVASEGVLSWDAVGTAWDVPINEVEIHVVADREFSAPECFRGGEGSQERCQVDQPEPGHLVATATDLDAHQGVTVSASLGAPITAAPALPAAGEPEPRDRLNPFAAGATGTVAALLAAGPVSWLIRRAGREQVWPGGATAAAFGPHGDGQQPMRIDSHELHTLATTEFAPPDGLEPSHGGILLTESVRNEHKVAWLIDAAGDGYIDLVGDKTLVRLDPPADADPEVEAIIDAAFGARREITLGEYDQEFSAAWDRVGEQLQQWRTGSGMWDRDADTRTVATRVLGGLVAVAGLAGVVFTAVFAARSGAGYLAGTAVAAVVAGAGIAALLRGWELRVRTPQGSAMWLRVESFRRFLAGSEAFHAEEAAKRGVLREYTAWAVAVGEIDRWSRAVAAATIAPAAASAIHWAMVAPVLASATSSTSTAPSSSGGGGGGGVGGGAGGGGGGSW